jgi:hypothetical protein
VPNLVMQVAAGKAAAIADYVGLSKLTEGETAQWWHDDLVDDLLDGSGWEPRC